MKLKSQLFYNFTTESHDVPEGHPKIVGNCVSKVPNDMRVAKFYETDQIQVRQEVIDFGANWFLIIWKILKEKHLQNFRI